MKKNILGIKIDDINMDQALEIVQGWLRQPGKHYIVTPNPEFILAAQKDKEFKEILNKADLAIPDSSNLGLSYWLLKKSRLERLLFWPLFFLPIKVVMQFDVVAGIDLMEALCKTAAEKGFTTGFLGGKERIAKKAAECLRKKYPKLKVVFAESGGQIGKDGQLTKDFGRQPHSLARQRKRPASASGGLGYARYARLGLAAFGGSLPSSISILPVDILFVAFGHIKQEKWIAKNLPNLPVKVAMGAGGAFDYLSGGVPRAPKWLRKLGLEWLFRLIIQPWRIKRQLALFKYLWLLLSSSRT